MRIELNPSKVFKILLCVIFFLLCANLIGIYCKFSLNYDHIYGLVPLFDFNTERNIPTIYSAFAIFSAFLLLSIIAISKKDLGSPHIAWACLAIIFLFLSIDELVSFHERLIKPVRSSLDTSGVLHFAWIIPYGMVLGLIILCYSKFLFSLPKKIMIMFFVSGSLFVAGAVGFEMIGGWHVSLHGSKTFLYSIIYTCEELLEMLGIATFIYTLLLYIANQASNLTLLVRE